jgi:2,3,4,5-tetrahydropyridine-2-carboxylate N-succinyltransferase
MTASTRIYDIVNDVVISPNPGEPLEVPEAAVVVPGSRRINSEFANEYGLSISTPIIIKYRDAKTDAKTALNYTLR